MHPIENPWSYYNYVKSFLSTASGTHYIFLYKLVILTKYWVSISKPYKVNYINAFEYLYHMTLVFVFILYDSLLFYVWVVKRNDFL